MAPIAAAGAWNMGQWDQMEAYVGAIEPRRAASTSATATLRAVLDVHHRDFRAARGAKEYTLNPKYEALNHLCHRHPARGAGCVPPGFPGGAGCVTLTF